MYVNYLLRLHFTMYKDNFMIIDIEHFFMNYYVISKTTKINLTELWSSIFLL